MPLIDLHTHVLPGLDDGARDLAESLSMLAQAQDDGVSTVVAAPHAHHAPAERVLHALDTLRAAACEAGLNVTILPGHEARIGAGLVDSYRAGTLLTINGTNWLLLECYLFDDWPIHLIERSVDRLLAAGLQPLLAHAERYPFVQRDPAALQPLLDRGIPIQINAGSLFLRQNEIERVTAETLLRSGSAHVIASDAHNARYRPPILRRAYDRATELVGEEYANWMQSVAEKVVEGSTVVLSSSPRWS